MYCTMLKKLTFSRKKIESISFFPKKYLDILHFRRVCLCCRKYFWAGFCALIKSTHSRDNILKVSKNSHFIFHFADGSAQQGRNHYFTCFLVIFRFWWCLSVLKNILLQTFVALMKSRHSGDHFLQV